MLPIVTAAARGRSTTSRLIIRVLAPVVVALGAAAAVVAPAAAAPAASTGSGLVSESFGGSTVADGSWRALGDGCLTRATSAPAASSLGACALRVNAPTTNASSGYLQLNDGTGYRKGGAVYTKASASALGLDVTFDQWQYGSSSYGGDGMVFFVADGAASVTSTGGEGSSMGYAQNTNRPAAPNGVAGAYLGVGLDVHGAFATSQDGHGTGCTTGQSSVVQANSVVLRGPGSAKNGYCLLTATNLPTSQKLHATLSDPAGLTPAMARRFRVTVSPDRFPTVTVYGAFPASTDLKQVLQYKMTDAAPSTYQFGFTASSGSVVDTHLIGNVAASTVGLPDTTPPVVTIAGGPSALVTSTTPKVSGTTDNPAGSTMNVAVGTQKLSTTVDSGSTWSVTPAALEQGPVTVTATATDAAGNTGTATQTLTVDSIAPAVTITGGASATTTAANPRLAGTTDAADDTSVAVTVADQKLHATVQAGAWSVTPETLENGTVTVTAEAKDLAGNTGTATQSLAIAVPRITITGGSKVLSNLAAPKISGTSTGFAGRTVTVSVDKQSVTSTASPTGAWSVTPTKLGEGGHQIVARVSSAAGVKASATQRLTIDTVAPAIVIDGGSTASTRSDTPTISGRVDLPAGSSVRVELDGDTRTLELSSTRTWSMTSRHLTVGTHAVVVSATDLAGNVGTRRQRLVLVPTLAVDGGKTRLTKDVTPRISGTTDAPSGTGVTVTVGGQTLTGTVSAPGTWSVTPDRLTSTVHPVLATLRDAYGNVRTARQTLTVDTVAPSIVIDGGSTASTRSTTPTISGRVNVPAGSSITVSVDGVAHAVTVSSTRTWSMTSPHLTAGTHTVVLTATDAAGNVGTQKQRLTVKS